MIRSAWIPPPHSSVRSSTSPAGAANNGLVLITKGNVFIINSGNNRIVRFPGHCPQRCATTIYCNGPDIVYGERRQREISMSSEPDDSLPNPWTSTRLSTHREILRVADEQQPDSPLGTGFSGRRLRSRAGRGSGARTAGLRDRHLHPRRFPSPLLSLTSNINAPPA